MIWQPVKLRILDELGQVAERFDAVVNMSNVPPSVGLAEWDSPFASCTVIIPEKLQSHPLFLQCRLEECVVVETDGCNAFQSLQPRQ